MTMYLGLIAVVLLIPVLGLTVVLPLVVIARRAEPPRLPPGVEMVLKITPTPLRLGETAAVRWRIGPRGASLRELSLFGRERTDATSRCAVQLPIVSQGGHGGEATFTLPRHGMPSFADGSHRFEWYVEADVSTPSGLDRRTFDVTVVTPAEPGAPEPAPERTIELHEPVIEPARTAVGPGEPIDAHVAWSLDRPPTRAVVRLRRTVDARDDRARSPRSHIELELDVANLPRVVRDGSPYRDLVAEAERDTLAARDLRRVQLVAPRSPPSYRGDLYEIAWHLELVLDGRVVAERPIVIALDRRAAGRAAPRRPA